MLARQEQCAEPPLNFPVDSLACTRNTIDCRRLINCFERLICFVKNVASSPGHRYYDRRTCIEDFTQFRPQSSNPRQFFCECEPHNGGVFDRIASTAASMTTSTMNDILTDTSDMAVFAEAQNGTTTVPVVEGSGLAAWEIALIVVACIITLLVASVLTACIVRKVRRQRRNRGQYKPQFEEEKNIRSLPYLPPPNIEGLI